ncbi:hypothetical protein BDN70DRAFT_998720, partial [Pholiota conissans]
MFSGSKNVAVTGGTFTMTGEFHTHNHVMNPHVDDGREGIRLLQQNISPGAFHNSDERYDPPKCHPRTREAIIKKIMEWIKDPDKLARFLWMYGPAGAGKSAIAQTIAELCHQANLLAAAFFFSRTAAGRNSKTNLINTLIYQLTVSIPEIRELVGKALERNPALVSMSLKAQTRSLLIEPLREVDVEAVKQRPLFLIVDGLDECGDAQSQEYILEVLGEAMEELSLPFFFLIASRPEQHIREAFNEDLLASLTQTLVLDDTYKPDADIRIFLDSKFQDIKKKHPSRARFPVPWPTEKDMGRLVGKSSGQFIYAATVMKYLESRRHLPTERLQIIFGLTSPGKDTPFVELDALYTHIFSSIGDIDKVMDLFCVLLFTDVSTVKKNPINIEEFLLYTPGEIDIILSELHSIISVPSPDDPKGILRISHASLSDFLFDRSRSGKFFIDTAVGHAKISTVILKHMIDNPKKWQKLAPSLFDHGSKAAALLNEISDGVTPKRGPKPIVFWSKVGIDDRWPNMARFLSWLRKHHHTDPSKDLTKHISDSIDGWLLTQLELYPKMSGTTHLLAAASLGGVASTSREIFDMINNGINWDPADVSDMRHIDPLRFFESYYEGQQSGEYYDYIAEFLMNPSRSKEFCVKPENYAAFSRLIIEFLLTKDLNNDKRYTKHIQIGLDRLKQALDKSVRTIDLAMFLEAHCGYLVCSDTENVFYEDLNKATDAIKAYVRESSQVP